MSEYRLGIDFGTCFSFIGVCGEDGNVSIFGSDESGYGIPSTFYHGSDLQNLTGDEAESFASSVRYDPTQVVRYVKQQLLTNEFSLQGGVVSPRFIVACIIRRLIEIAKKEMVALDSLGDLSMSGAVISVPVSFDRDTDKQRYHLIKNAARDAGLEDVKLIQEPVAAAISYCYNQTKRVKEPILVFDLGGGTFDVACLRPRADLTYHILQPLGIEHIGGICWTEALVEYFVDRIDKLDSSSLKYDRDVSMQELLNSGSGVIEKLKRYLSQENIADNTYRQVPILHEILKNPFHEPNNIFNLNINRNIFNSITEPLLQELLKLVDESSVKCGLNTRPTAHVVLSGGASRMPQIKDGILSILKNKYGVKILNEKRMIHLPDKAIARGAAMSAFGLNIKHLINNSFTLGDIFVDI